VLSHESLWTWLLSIEKRRGGNEVTCHCIRNCRRLAQECSEMDIVGRLCLTSQWKCQWLTLGLLPPWTADLGCLANATFNLVNYTNPSAIEITPSATLDDCKQCLDTQFASKRVREKVNVTLIRCIPRLEYSWISVASTKKSRGNWTGRARA